MISRHYLLSGFSLLACVLLTTLVRENRLFETDTSAVIDEFHPNSVVSSDFDEFQFLRSEVEDLGKNGSFLPTINIKDGQKTVACLGGNVHCGWATRAGFRRVTALSRATLALIYYKAKTKFRDITNTMFNNIGGATWCIGGSVSMPHFDDWQTC